jgi:flavorubredoxin
MHRAAGYNESRELTRLIEQLRERLGAMPPLSPRLVHQLEEVLSRLVVRNQRLRVLHRLARKGGSDEHIDSIRTALEKLDAELLQELPGVLNRWHEHH